MVLDKIVWVRADREEPAADRKKIIACALKNGFTDIVVRKEDINTIEIPGMFNAITFLEGKIETAKGKGSYIEIQGKEDETSAAELAGRVDYVVVSAKNWKVIPVENLIAAFQKSETKLLVEVGGAEDAGLFLKTLEVGADGVVLSTENLEEIAAVRNLLEELENTQVALVEAGITKIKPVGLGERVCVDSCTMMETGEGMLIGSQSSGLFLVHSESVVSEFVDTRPFRVNAGSVHSYIMAKGGRTRYLSELAAGDDIMVVDSSGNTRTVVLGRVKIEKRPLVLLEAKFQDEPYNIILQNAETIRLVSGGKPVSIIDLKVGDKVLMRVDQGGRHFGMKVEKNC